LIDLSTAANSKRSDQPWVTFRSAGWVKIQLAPTRWHSFFVPLIHLHHDSSSRASLAEEFNATEKGQAVRDIAIMPQEEVEALASELGAFFE
jgi:hypothetical protein